MTEKPAVAAFPENMHDFSQVLQRNGSGDGATSPRRKRREVAASPTSWLLAGVILTLLAVLPAARCEETNSPPGLRMAPAGVVAFLDELRPPALKDTERIFREDLKSLLRDMDPNKPFDIKSPAMNKARKALVDMYKSGGFEKVKALAKDGTIDPHSSGMIASMRNAMIEVAMASMAARLGEVRVNDFSTAPTAQSDIDQTFHPILEEGPDGKIRVKRHPDDPGKVLDGVALKEMFNAEFHALFGIEPDRMEVSSHAGEAAIPDWRQHGDFDEFAVRLAKGSELLRANPEAYFLEGAYRRQVDRRSFQSDKPLYRIFRPLRTVKPGVQIIRLTRDERVGVERRLAREEVYRNISPEWRRSYGFGAAVGNLLFFQHHKAPEDVAERAKYLMRSMEDGMASLVLPASGEAKLFFDLPAAERMAMLQKVYGDLEPERVRKISMMYDVAEQIRTRRTELSSKTVRQEIYRPVILEILGKEHANPEAVLATMGEKAMEGLLADAEKHFREQSHALLMENAVRAAGPRLKDWLNPEAIDKKKIPEEFRKVFEQDPDKFRDKLRLAALSEVWDAFERLDSSTIDKIIQNEADANHKRALMDIRDGTRLKRELLSDYAREKSYFKRLVIEAKTLGVSLSRLHRDLQGEWQDGRYTVPEKFTRMKALVCERLGFRYEGDLGRLQRAADEAGTKWDTGKLAGYVFNLGNVDSAIQIIKAGQQSDWSWSSMGWAAGMEVLSNVQGVAPVLAVYGALFEGEFEGVAVMVAAYYVPAVGQVYMVYNIAKGTMEIMDFDISRGISDLVYQGYEPEETGGFWGFIRYVRPSKYIRGIATMTSQYQPATILEFVPGRTFRERRLNLFSRYDSQIIKGLNVQGIKPEELDATRKRLAEPFFYKLVNEYADQKGEFADLVIPGGLKFRQYLSRPEVRTGLRDRLVSDYAGGLANLRMQEHQADLQEMQQDADQAAEFLARMKDGLQKTEEQTRPDLPLVSGLPDFPDPDTADVEKRLQVDLQSEPVIQIEMPDRLLSPGDLANLKARCFAPPGRFKKPFDYQWTIEGLEGQEESTGPYQGLIFRQGSTRRTEAKVTVAVKDADGKAVGSASSMLRFGKLGEGETAAPGRFALLNVTVQAYSAVGRKEGDKLDIVEQVWWVPALVNAERSLDAAVKDVRDAVEQRYPPPAGNRLQEWMNLGAAGQFTFSCTVAASGKELPSAFKPEDVPQGTVQTKSGEGPVWKR